MAVIEFPSPQSADEYGLVAVGGDWEVASLLLAYSQGIFPWPVEQYELAWFSPDPRGVLFFDKLHLSQSFKRFLKKNNFEVSFNQNFSEVIHHCAHSANRKEGKKTWITTSLMQAYINLFKYGYAYSVEVWEKKHLVGGMYGVILGNFVSGESMFYLRPNASKLALVKAIEHFSSQGIKWIDTQMTTPLVKSFGGEEISRNKFLKLLSQCQFENNRNKYF